MSVVAYRDFIGRLRKEIYPFPGEANSQVATHSRHFLQAMIDLGTAIECVQVNQTDVHAACSTLIDCGKTVIDAPIGIITAVYTIANGDWCNKVYADSGDWPRVEQWSRRLESTYKAPSNAGLPALKQGLLYASKTSDSPVGRSHIGLWALNRKRLYLAPWMQSNESLVIEWDGVKNNWKDDDLVDLDLWTPDYELAIKAFVQWHDALDFPANHTDPTAARALFKGEFMEMRAELMHRCADRTRQKPVRDYPNPLPTQAQLDAEKVQPDSTAGAAFAWIGSNGDQNANSDAVAALVIGWSPTYIVTTGDNWFGTSTDVTDLDTAAGRLWSAFIFPYSGIYAGGATAQKFFPAIGNHDRDPVGRLPLELDYFTMPGAYYDFVQGPIHYFVLDTGYDSSGVNQQPDGIDLASVQGVWLQTKLALSTARFKAVVLHHPPYSSAPSPNNSAPYAGDGTLSYPTLRWPFKAWGADVVVAGHANSYERLTVDGIPYLVNGAGGWAGDTDEPADFTTPQAASESRVTGFGAIRGTSDCNTLTLEFVSVGGTVEDTVTISK